MNKRDWYLNKLEIPQYILRNSQAIKGEAKVEITDNIRLIVVSQNHPTEKIFQDILNAIHVISDDCLVLMPTQLLMPAKEIKSVIWFIDTPLPEHWSEQDISNTAIIKTYSLRELASSPQQKRQLWRTLCQYEKNFQTH